MLYGTFPNRHIPTITGWCVTHSCEASLEFPCAECLMEMPAGKDREYWVQHRMLSESIREERLKESFQKMLVGV